MNAKHIAGSLLLVSVLLFVWYYYNDATTPGQYDEFAQCIADSGSIFYGAFWCHNCDDQKDLFGKSERLLTYVECSTPDRRGQLQICKDANIKAYPTWEFPDNSRLTGSLPFDILADRTGCDIPE